MVGETGLAPARASAHEFLRLACMHSTTHRKIGAAGASCTPTRRSGAAVFKTARSTVPRTAADWSRRPESHRHGQSRPAGFESAVSTFQPRRDKLVRTEGIAPHELSPTGSSGRRVYCFATSAKTGASTGTCALLSVLPRQSVAFYGLDAKWSKRKDSHLRSPSGRRVYSALHLLLCHASKKMGARAGFAPAAFSL